MMMLFRKLLLSITASDRRKASPEPNPRATKGCRVAENSICPTKKSLNMEPGT